MATKPVGAGVGELVVEVGAVVAAKCLVKAVVVVVVVVVPLVLVANRLKNKAPKRYRKVPIRILLVNVVYLLEQVKVI